MNDPMTHVSLFTGIGGLDLAAEWAGFETILQVERDPYCLRVLEKRWPGVKRITDIREVKADAVNRPVTVISGGFPCQPFSHAGKRRGTEDDRYLWPEMLRVIHEINPAWVVAENVPGLLSIDEGMVFSSVLSDLEGEGYETLPLVYPACGVGANHRRARVFILGYSRRGGLRGESWGAEPIRQEHGSAQCVCEDVPDSSIMRRGEGVQNSGRRGEGAGTEEERSRFAVNNWWKFEPDVGRTLNGFSCWLDGFDMTESHVLLLAYGNAKKERPDKILSTVRSFFEKEKERRYPHISPAQVLFTYLCKLQEKQAHETRLQLASKKASQGILRSMPADNELAGTSYRPEHIEQFSGKHPDSMQELSRLLALNAEKAWMEYRRSDAFFGGWEDGIPRIAKAIPHRVDRLRALGNAVVPQQAYPIFRAIAAVVSRFER